MIDAAGKAIRYHGRWRVVYERLEPRIGKSKAKVAIARKMLVAVWHILTKEEVDKYADPVQVACALFALAYQLGVRNLPEKRSAKEFVRHHLDRLKIGREVREIPWGSKRFKLPLSKLRPEEVVALQAAGP